MLINYDTKNRASSYSNIVGTLSNVISYLYGDTAATGQKPGLLYGIKVGSTQRLTYNYDILSRLNTRTLNLSSNYNTSYTYTQGVSANTTTTLLASITNGSNAAISYTYDNVGNIESISEGGTQKAKYYYDELSQLVREDNVWLNKTITYTYDAGGNLTVKNEYAYTTGTLGTVITSHTYTYDTTWKDKLSSYEGNTITYDSIGNPTQYYNGYTFTWQNGRQLASVNNGSNTINYQYNDSGIRTKKSVVNGVTTDYYLNGSNIVTEIRGSDRLDYYYDEQGNLFGFKVNNASEYYYIRNGQNDIIGILDSTGAQVVSYSYDTWGKPVSTTGTLASTIGALNPFRYRGYYYDESSGLYYLSSRYYDANTGRFINADGVVSSGQGLSSYNMFSYCGNNPVNRCDPSGHFWEVIGNFFTGIFSTIGNFCSGIFGASYTSSIETPDIANSKDYSLLNLTGLEISLNASTKAYNIGDSSKPISVYAENVNGDITKASAGIKLNIANVKVKLNLSLSDISLGYGVENGDTEWMNSSGISLTGLSLFSKINVTKNVDSKNSVSSCVKVYAGIYPLAAAYACYVSGGSMFVWDSAPEMQPAK